MEFDGSDISNPQYTDHSGEVCIGTVAGLCCCRMGCILLLDAAAVSCVNSNVVMYCLVLGFNSDCKQNWGEPTDGPIYPMGNLVRGIYPTTQQKKFVRGREREKERESISVCMQVCVFEPEWKARHQEIKISIFGF